MRNLTGTYRYLILLGVLFIFAFAYGSGKESTHTHGTSAESAMTNEASAAAAGATITGTVKFEGKVPRLGILKMEAEPACAAKHPTPVKSQALVLGEGNTMGNIFVKIKSGLKKKDYPVPTEPVVVDQNGCMYHPHVFGIRAGQTLKILNSDGILHNIHPLPKINAQFNLAMPKFKKVSKKKFTKVEEDPFLIKCDVHPWMGAYAAVMGHPFFNVTGKDGKFEISGLPAGTYEVEAWHEKLGTRTATVTVADGETKTIDFTFKRK